MTSLDSIKALYENTDEKILIADDKLSVLWKNSSDLPDFVSLNDFGDCFEKPPRLPILKTVVLRYTDRYTVKIVPVKEEDKPVGYIILFFDPEEIETLYDRSVHYKYKRNMSGNERMALMPLINILDEYYSAGEVIPPEFFHKAKAQVVKLLSSTVNYSELAKYYNGTVFTELLNVSQCLEDTAEAFRKAYPDDKCDFSCDIQPGLFKVMNSDCMMTAVLNLLVNGYMYNKREDKQLKLKAYKDADKICIEVWDNGENADCEKMKRAMEPFSGLDKFGQGESLGLALANKFAAHFGGEMSLDKTEGQGLTVKIIFEAKIDEKPKSFRLRRQPLMVGEFEPAACILAKGNNN